MTAPQTPPVDECLDCQQKGRYDGRVLIGGRGLYRCPDGHMWQDADETPSFKASMPIDFPVSPSGGLGLVPPIVPNPALEAGDE